MKLTVKKLNFGIVFWMEVHSLDFAQYHIYKANFRETSRYFHGHSNIILRTCAQQAGDFFCMKPY